jgi:hypothetical protein
MLWLSTVRSTGAHARLRTIDYDRHIRCTRLSSTAPLRNETDQQVESIVALRPRRLRLGVLERVYRMGSSLAI